MSTISNNELLGSCWSLLLGVAPRDLPLEITEETLGNQGVYLDTDFSHPIGRVTTVHVDDRHCIWISIELNSDTTSVPSWLRRFKQAYFEHHKMQLAPFMRRTETDVWQHYYYAKKSTSNQWSGLVLVPISKLRGAGNMFRIKRNEPDQVASSSSSAAPELRADLRPEPNKNYLPQKKRPRDDDDL